MTISKYMDAPKLPAEGELSDFERMALDRWAKHDLRRINQSARWRDFQARRAGLVGGRIFHRVEKCDHPDCWDKDLSKHVEYKLYLRETDLQQSIDLHEWAGRVEHQPLKYRLDILPGGIQFKKEPLKRKAWTGGGGRSEIAGFSKDSQSRLMSLLQRVKFDEYSATGKRSPAARAFFITLTYSDNAPCLEGQETGFDWKTAKRDVDAFGKRLKRLKNFRGLLWKMEIEPRKSGERKGQLVPHFHCLIVWHKIQRINFFRKWLSLAWFKVVASDDPSHLLAGTNSLVAYGGSSGKLFSYLGKYMGKVFSFENLQVGRVWGVIACTDPATGVAMKNPLDLAKARAFFTNDCNLWQAFIDRVKAWGIKSEYLSRLSIYQSAAKIYGKADEMLELISGMNFTEYRPPDLRSM